MAIEDAAKKKKEEVEETMITLKRVGAGQCSLIGFMMHMLMS